MGPLALTDRHHCVLSCQKPLRQTLRLDGAEILRCPECGLVYRSPYLSTEAMRQVYASGKDLGKQFPVFEGYLEASEDPTRDTPTRRAFLRSLERLEKTPFLPERTLMDLGCGRGLFLKLAKDRGWTAQGVDFGKENVAFARQTYGLDVEEADIFRKDWKKRYGAVTLWDLLEHVPEPLELLRVVRHLLEEGGVVLAALPRENNVYSWIAKGVYHASSGKSRRLLELLYPSEHLTYYSADSAERLFAAAGLRVEKIETQMSDLGRMTLPLPMRAGMTFLNGAGSVVGGQTRLLVYARKNRS